MSDERKINLGDVFFAGVDEYVVEFTPEFVSLADRIADELIHAGEGDKIFHWKVPFALALCRQRGMRPQSIYSLYCVPFLRPFFNACGPVREVTEGNLYKPEPLTHDRSLWTKEDYANNAHNDLMAVNYFFEPCAYAIERIKSGELELTEKLLGEIHSKQRAVDEFLKMAFECLQECR
jgi:hypothetical protein